MAREAQVLNTRGEIVVVPVGITLGVFVGPVAGQVALEVRNVSGGGTLSIIESSAGTTMPGATLAALAATFLFTMGVAPNFDGKIAIDGPAAFYLAATGATTTVHLLRKLGSGF